MDKVEDIVAKLRTFHQRGKDWYGMEINELSEAAELIQSQQALIEETREALETYMFAVEQMNAAMKDGINVQGAISTLIGAEDMAKFILSKALSQKDQIDG